VLAVKSLKADDRCNIPAALGAAYDMLHRYRAIYANDGDNLYNGWYTDSAAPASIVLLTNGGKFTDRSGVIRPKLINIPGSGPCPIYSIPQSDFPGSEFFEDRGRWDHQIYIHMISKAGIHWDAKQASIQPNRLRKSPSSEQRYLEHLASSTGGRYYEHQEQPMKSGARELNEWFKRSFKSRLTPCLTVRFVDLSTRSEQEQAFVQRIKFRSKADGCNANWPIPECFVPSKSHQEFRKRSAQPTIYFDRSCSEEVHQFARLEFSRAMKGETELANTPLELIRYNSQFIDTVRFLSFSNTICVDFIYIYIFCLLYLCSFSLSPSHYFLLCSSSPSSDISRNSFSYGRSRPIALD